jgi:hypothetical protein
MTPDELKEVERFAAEVVEYERTHADPARDAAEDAEWAKLQAQYPGEFVAYLDAWDGKTLTRTVLTHDPDIGKIMEVAATWPAEEQDAAKVDYVFPMNSLAFGLPLLTRGGKR